MAREMKDSGVEWIGEIPKDWKVVRNKNCFICSKEVIGQESLNTQLLSLTTYGVKKKNVNETAGKVPESYDTYQVVHKNDIIMCLFDLDCSAVFSGISLYEGMISPAYKILKCKKDVVPNYIDYWFRYVFDGRKFKHYAKNLRYTLNYDEFALLPIVVPSASEQIKIADFLDKTCQKIDNILSKTRASIEEYKKLKQAIIMQAVTKGVRGKREMKDSGIEWIGEIPKEWNTIKIKWILNERKLKSENGMEEPLSMSQKFGIIPTKEMEMIPNVASSFVGAKIVYNGDLVFNKLKAHLGVFAVSKYNGLVSPDYAVYYSKGVAEVQFLEYLFKTPQYINEFKKKSSGVGAGLTRLYTDDLFSIYCILPCKDEQLEIIRYLDKKVKEMDELIIKKEQYITEIEN